MSSRKYATPLILEPHPSRWLLFLMLFAHGGAIVVLLALDEWPWPLQLSLVVMVLTSLWFVLGRQGWRKMPGQIRRLVWSTDNDWQLVLRNGKTLHAELRPSSFLHPWLVVLSLRVEGRRLPQSLALARDSLDETTFRRLRVRLTTESGGLFNADDNAT